MEPIMYASIVQMVTENDWKIDIVESGAERKKWKKRLTQFTVREDGGLMWNGLKVPTLDQVEQILQPIHYGKEMHIKDKRILRKALSDVGFVLPPFAGGLEQAAYL